MAFAVIRSKIVGFLFLSVTSMTVKIDRKSRVLRVGPKSNAHDGGVPGRVRLFPSVSDPSGEKRKGLAKNFIRIESF